MSSIFSIFGPLVYQPIYNILVFLYNIIPGHDFGVAIIVITVLLKFALYPISRKQIESQKRLQELQPKIKEIQSRNKDNKEKQTKELLEFYKTNKANPFSGCLPIVAQLIFFIAIYQVLYDISSSNLVIQQDLLYGFVKNPETINPLFFGFIDLGKPYIPLAAIAAIAQFFQTKDLMATKKADAKKEPEKKTTDSKQPDFSEIMSKQMLYLGPFLTLFIGMKFAAGLALYWLVSTLFSFAQQLCIKKNVNK
jgi:YidC/Oxa1 family membrane protein insertase